MSTVEKFTRVLAGNEYRSAEKIDVKGVKYNCKSYVELRNDDTQDVTVHYNYFPEEARTWDYPGSPEDVEFFVENEYGEDITENLSIATIKRLREDCIIDNYEKMRDCDSY